MTTLALDPAPPHAGGAGDALPAEVRIAIVGAGFSGIGLAIRLRQAGVEDFVVLERADDVGGTWQANTYPGCQCDIPSHLYSFSFAPNPSWTRTYSRQPEIWDYLRDVSRRYGVTAHVRFGHELTGADWDEAAQRWQVQTSHGSTSAQLLVDATGGLSQPSIPPLPGLERFEGTVFHSARWDHDHDLAGKRVAVVGTGASSIQFVPRIAKRVAQLHVLQRTAPWIMPHTDRPTTRVERRLYARLPALQRLVRAGVYWSKEALAVGVTRDPRLLAPLERIGRAHLRKQVADPELRRKLEPDFRVGCKRILLSNDWYPALMRPNVEVVTDAIAEIRAHSIVLADGSERAVDTIIFGTGFAVTDPPTLGVIRARDGRSLAEHAREEGAQAYLGTTVPGLPNYLRMTGPNTGLGHNSMVFMIEAQLRYVLDCVRVMDERGIASFELRPEANAAYNDALQRRMERTVWMSGCSSWYLDANGRNVTLWPDYTWRYRHRTCRFDTRPYVMKTGVPAVAR